MAQSSGYFVIVVGNFMNAKPQDFEALRPLGFVHSARMNDNLYQIYLGGYNEKAEAEKVITQIKQKGYTSAYVQERFPREGRTVTVIQIATRLKDKPVGWEKLMEVGDLYAILNEGQLKITTGLYPNVEAAKGALDAIRRKGYKDAFIKNVNSIYLHEVTEFETGIKKPLIPLSFDNQSRERIVARTSAGAGTEPIPGSYDQVTARSVSGVTAAPSRAVPAIRPNVKRKSALELQKVLKAEGAYKGSLDGLYGTGTTSAYETFLESNRDLQKYALVGKAMNFGGQTGTDDALQQAINNLLDDPAASAVIERYNNPVSKAYQAYLLFTTLGPRSEVNTLMNGAIRQAYDGKTLKERPPFDYRATYAYQDLEQLVLHIHYIHSAPGNQYIVPCWMFQRHPKETASAYDAYARFSSAEFRLLACDQFLSWNEIRTMQAIAVDLNPNEKFNSAKLAESASNRARLFTAPQSPTREARQLLEEWDRRLWSGLNAWSVRDPLNQKTITAFKVAYFQSQVRLEDYYMDQGFNADDAKVLALATLQTLVGYHLERYIS